MLLKIIVYKLCDDNQEKIIIISASRRTDIPAFYSEWFVKRLQAGSVCVRNPMNYNKISRIPLNREVVDCIVFWTKNPMPMLPMIDMIDEMGNPYYFQFTITPYIKNIETSLGDKRKILESFCFLSKKLGNFEIHNPNSEILIGKLFGDEKITDRKVKSFLDKQVGF